MLSKYSDSDSDSDGKRKHAGIFSQMGLDVGIHSYIYY